MSKIKRTYTLYDPETGEIDSVLHGYSEKSLTMHKDRIAALVNKTLDHLPGEHNYLTHKINIHTKQPIHRGAPIEMLPTPALTMKEKRQREYPPIEDQVVALITGGPDLDNIRNQIAIVNAKYPIEGE